MSATWLHRAISWDKQASSRLQGIDMYVLLCSRYVRPIVARLRQSWGEAKVAGQSLNILLKKSASLIVAHKDEIGTTTVNRHSSIRTSF